MKRRRIMETKQRWQDWINLILGLWLLVAPFLGVGLHADAAAWNSYIFGAIIALLSAAALGKPQAWEEWTNLVIGCG
ncbi:MAG: SPW repeat domain-containing protein [Pseudomonadota bacterium]